MKKQNIKIINLSNILSEFKYIIINKIRNNKRIKEKKAKKDSIKFNIIYIYLYIGVIIICSYLVLKIITNNISICNNISSIKNEIQNLDTKNNFINNFINNNKNNKESILVSNIENKTYSDLTGYTMCKNNSKDLYNIILSKKNLLNKITNNKVPIIYECRNNNIDNNLSNKEHNNSNSKIIDVPLIYECRNNNIDNNLSNKEHNNSNSKIIDVPYLSQAKYPTGCESVSTVMLLNYYNIDVTVDEFINRYLKKDSLTTINSNLYSSSPNEAFIGNPYSKDSYGCYIPVIEKSINMLLKEKKINNEYIVNNLSGKNLEEIAKTYIDKNIPLLIWGTINMKPVSEGNKWYLYDNSIYTWKANEHCLVLVGYDDEYYYFNDPLQKNNKEENNNNNILKNREDIHYIKYKKDIVNERYNSLNKQALCILKNY